jgi:hypothetical protein
MLIGWYLTGTVAINMRSPRDLGDVFEAFVLIAPIGGLVGLCVGVWLFRKLAEHYNPM